MNNWNTLINPEKNGKCHVDATIEQLYDCVSLLAQSIVHHRSKYGAVPFEYSLNKLGTGIHEAATGSELANARQTLNEVLELIKNSSSQLTEIKTTKTGKECKRQQVRVSVSAPIYVMPDQSITPLKAKLANISWGGATLHIDHRIGEIGDTVHIELPSFNDRHINARATILRTSTVNGELAYSVRFTNLRTDDEHEFQQLIEFLASSGDVKGQRRNARLSQRIDIQYDNASDLQATLEDISTGGMSITVPEPMELNQSLLAVISTTDQVCQLLLRARVIWQECIDSANIEVYRAGLEFEHSTEDLKNQISKMIHKMASTSPIEKV